MFLRCGPDPDNGLPDARPENCTLNAKLPMYWYQQDGNNVNPPMHAYTARAHMLT